MLMPRAGPRRRRRRWPVRVGGNACRCCAARLLLAAPSLPCSIITATPAHAPHAPNLRPLPLLLSLAATEES